ncbi:MAG: RNA polymerase sigma factor [Mangrovibacterium sp.]
MEEYDHHNEMQLVKKLKTGDLNAFNQLFNVYSSRLYHFAYGYLKSKDEAEELVQETFCKVWERKNDLKEEFQFPSYLFAIAFNYVRKYFRSKALLNKYMESGAVRSDQDALINPDVNYSSLREWVDRLVDEMPEKRRAVFIKSRYEGKTATDIAKEMNISKSTVENHLNQALRHLRNCLKEEHLAGGLFFFLFLQ